MPILSLDPWKMASPLRTSEQAEREKALIDYRVQPAEGDWDPAKVSLHAAVHQEVQGEVGGWGIHCKEPAVGS